MSHLCFSFEFQEVILTRPYRSKKEKQQRRMPAYPECPWHQSTADEGIPVSDKRFTFPPPPLPSSARCAVGGGEAAPEPD